MFSRILTKLIDEAVLPALALVAAKILGTILVIKYFNIPVESTSTFFKVYISSKESFLLVNSYSTLFMYLVVAAGALLFFVRSRWFHDTHITPSFAVKIFSFRLGNFIKTSMDVYSEGTIWLSYSYLMTFVLGAELFFGMVYSWVFMLSFALSIILTLIFVSDVEKELTS